MERKKKTIKNISVSFGLEIINILSGFILPRLIIGFYGSSTNGLINSISSFIGYVILLQSGVGSVTKAVLYKPLAENDKQKINDIIATLETFFGRISIISVIYVFFLVVFFSIRMSNEFDYLFTASLVIIISFSTVAQYFWGMPYQILLEADQKGYVYSFVQGITVLVNTVLSIILIKCGFSIQIVKLATAFVFVLRPIIIRSYSRKLYKINIAGKVDLQLLKSRWDGFAQAIAYFVHSKTDIFVLTIFAVLSDISVYSVYALILTALSTIVMAVDKAAGPAFGNIIAKEESILHKRFEIYCNIVHALSTILFGTACITASGFVHIYTISVNDYSYVRPLFGLLIFASEYVHCLRLPYNCIIYAAGRIKETRNSAIAEAVINLTLSVILVNIWRLEGVALATLVAMIYRTISLVDYLRKDVLYLPLKKEMKRFIISFVSFVPCVPLMFIAENNNYANNSYYTWALFACVVFLLYSFYVIFVNYIFNRKELKTTIRYLINR